jgi:eukaryotic-like serine/threonine-protein kinase
MTELDIFSGALALNDPTERSSYLERACAEKPGLRRRIDALLAVDLAKDSPLDCPAEPPAAFVATGAFSSSDPALAPANDDRDPLRSRSREEAAGSILQGRYKLIEEIGEGGMGSVWMAQQMEPVKRAVAVKLIKAGMDSQAVLARFEAERQALAMMDHPNIAKVLDAGATESGLPFFVMELVKGVPITTFCDQRKLTPRERLQLFVPVCLAVQHAHQKGVIHRDIKPSNVLIALYDDKPVPKVIDFGVAKAAGQPLTDRTLMTGFGAVVGTPEYMSPEQASFNQLDVDTRSDVYALGVLLYELLTGTTPIDRTKLGKAAVLEVLRIVREVEPPRPSTKLSTDAALPSIAANRNVEPSKLAKLMRGELDWVVMKALEKDRGRRYETANGLALDIQRYLADEVVEARPPSAGYRLRKLVRRHKGRVIAASLVLVALVAGVIGTVIGLLEARTQRDVAEQARQKETGERVRAEEAATAAKAAREDEARQRAKAEQATTAEKAASQLAQRQLYFNQIALAQQYWRADDGDQVNRLLSAAPAEFRGWEWHYLDRLRRTELLSLPGNCQFTKTLHLSADGKRMLAFADAGDAGAGVWDLTTNKPLANVRLFNVNRTFTSGTLAPDGMTLVLGERSGVVSLWDATTGKPGKELGKLSDSIRSVSVSDDGKRVLAAAGSVQSKPEWRMWDLATGAAIPTSANIPLAIVFAPGGRVLGMKKNPSISLPSPVRQQFAVLWSLAGILIRSSVHEEVTVLWDLASGKEERVFGLTQGVCAFSADGKRVAVGGFDEKMRPQIRVIDLAEGRSVMSVAVPALGPLAFSPDGKLLVTAMKFGRALDVWDLKTGLKVRTLRGHTGSISAVTFTPDGRLVSSSWDGTIRFWDATADQEILTLSGNAVSHPIQAAIHPLGEQVALVSGARFGILIGRVVIGPPSSAVHLWSPGGTSRLEAGLIDRPDRLAYSNDGHRLLAGGQDGRLSVLEIKTKTRIGGFKHDGQIKAAALSPDGKWAVSSHEPREASLPPKDGVWKPIPGDARVWNAATGAELYLLKGHEGTVYAAAISDDGAKIATACYGQLRIWNAATGQLRFEVKRPEVGADGLLFSPSGTIVATASQDAVRLWDAATGAKLAELPGQGGNRFAAMTFNVDGSRIATAYGRVVRLWDTATGQEILTLPVPGENLWVLTLGFVPERGRLLAALSDGSIRAWEAPGENK